MADNILVSVILMKWSGVDVATHILTDNKYNCYFTLSVIINIIPLQQHLQLKHCFYWKRFIPRNIKSARVWIECYLKKKKKKRSTSRDFYRYFEVWSILDA